MVRRLPALVLVSLCALPLMASEGSDWSEMLSCQFYWEGNYKEALRAGQEILAGDADVAEKVEASKCVAQSQLALHQETPARKTMADMLNMDPGARFSPAFAYTPATVELYHAVRDSVQPGTMDIRTVAIGDFEDNSVYTGEFKDLDFSLFAPALVHLITADLAAATPLSIVDRQRTETIVKELELGQSGFADPESAVQAGHLLGAHTFVFGQYMVLSKDLVRIDARVVYTATGEIVHTEQITGEFSGDPAKFMELERRLVLSLAEGIEEVARKQGETLQLMKDAERHFQQKRQTAADRPDYVEGVLLTGRAQKLEDEGNFTAARETWRKVQSADPGHETAGFRLQVLNLFAADE